MEKHRKKKKDRIDEIYIKEKKKKTREIHIGAEVRKKKEREKTWRGKEKATTGRWFERGEKKE